MATSDVHNLPPAIDLVTAAHLLGIGRTAAYELVRTDAWPTPVLRLGRLIRIPTAPLLALLGHGAECRDWHPNPPNGGAAADVVEEAQSA
jgi:predicted DNA-binding transcriptional regulator AlpA